MTGDPLQSDPCVCEQTSPDELPGKLLEHFGGSYSSALGINVASMESDEVFKWFLASVLLGSGVSESIAINTYREFEKVGMNRVEVVAATSPQDLVKLLHRGGYTARYSETVLRLLRAMQTLDKRYHGDLNRLHFFALDGRDLKRGLRGLGGIGPSTIDTFLRGLRGFWEKAEPALSKQAVLASNCLGLTNEAQEAVALVTLQALWERGGHNGEPFSDFETSLAKLGSRYCQRKRCSACPVRPDCRTGDTSPERVTLTRR